MKRWVLVLVDAMKLEVEGNGDVIEGVWSPQHQSKKGLQKETWKADAASNLSMK